MELISFYYYFNFYELWLLNVSKSPFSFNLYSQKNFLIGVVSYADSFPALEASGINSTWLWHISHFLHCCTHFANFQSSLKIRKCNAEWAAASEPARQCQRRLCPLPRMACGGRYAPESSGNVSVFFLYAQSCIFLLFFTFSLASWGGIFLGPFQNQILNLFSSGLHLHGSL